MWLSYDQAFREHAAATNLSDCSSINVKLFHFHAAGTSARQAPGEGIQECPEVVGTISVGVVCKSWNRRKCTFPYSSCKYAHVRSNSAAYHRVPACPCNSRSQPSRRSCSPCTARYKVKAKRTYVLWVRSLSFAQLVECLLFQLVSFVAVFVYFAISCDQLSSIRFTAVRFYM